MCATWNTLITNGDLMMGIAVQAAQITGSMRGEGTLGVGAMTEVVLAGEHHGKIRTMHLVPMGKVAVAVGPEPGSMIMVMQTPGAATQRGETTIVVMTTAQTSTPAEQEGSHQEVKTTRGQEGAQLTRQEGMNMTEKEGRRYHVTTGQIQTTKVTVVTKTGKYMT
jgi:hypothetical protein